MQGTDCQLKVFYWGNGHISVHEDYHYSIRKPIYTKREIWWQQVHNACLLFVKERMETEFEYRKETLFHYTFCTMTLRGKKE